MFDEKHKEINDYIDSIYQEKSINFEEGESKSIILIPKEIIPSKHNYANYIKEELKKIVEKTVEIQKLDDKIRSEITNIKKKDYRNRLFISNTKVEKENPKETPKDVPTEIIFIKKDSIEIYLYSFFIVVLLLLIIFK